MLVQGVQNESYNFKTRVYELFTNPYTDTDTDTDSCLLSKGIIVPHNERLYKRHSTAQKLLSN